MKESKDLQLDNESLGDCEGHKTDDINSNNPELRLAGIIRESIVDGPGIRFVIFCQGCPHACKGCHNPETHDFNGGKPCSIDKLIEAIDGNPILQGVTFSGGEPLCQATAFLRLAKEIKARGLNLLVYTGFTFEKLLSMREKDSDLDKLLNLVDILIDGPFIEKLKDLTLLYRGSSNQRILDMKKSNDEGKAVLLENDMELSHFG